MNDYPNQLCAVKRTDKVLGADAQFFSNGTLEIHNGFSRVVFTIVDKTNGKTITPKANLPAREIRGVYALSDSCFKSHVEGGLLTHLLGKTANSSASSDDVLIDSPAYTQKLFDNKFKGKTPADVLLENPDAKDDLIRTKNWLAQNISKYKGNALQIAAIEEAIKLLEVGELRPVENTKSSTEILIYEPECKFMSMKNAAGNNLIYSLQITYDSAKRYPFTLTIMNCYAPVVNGTGGQKNIQMSAATDMVKSSFSMKANEWYGMISHINSVLDKFEALKLPEALANAAEASYKHE